MKSFRSTTIALALLLLAGAASAQQQRRGSRYLPTDSWAYDAITELRTRGYLPGLDPLAQPYTRDEVAAALLASDTAGMGRGLRQYARLLRQELRPELRRMAHADSLDLGFTAYAGGAAATTRSQDPLLPLRGTPAYSNSRAWPYYALELWGERSAFVADARLYHDLYLEGNGRGDPYGQDPGGIVVLNRTDNAYVSARYSLGTLMVGRMKRNWGPLGQGGLMVSDGGTSFAQAGLDMGGRHLLFRFFAGELNQIARKDRHMTANHVEYRSDRFALSIGEANVFQTDVGWRLRDLNPVELSFFEHDLNPKDGPTNATLDGSLWWQAAGTTLRGEFLLDDIDVLHAGHRAPARFALSGGLRNAALVPGVQLGLDYEAVAAWTYRTPYVTDQWTIFGRGLGANQSDFDRLTLSASFLPPIPGLRLTPIAQLQRKGEGGIRDTMTAAWLTSRTFFLGVREATLRAGLRGRYQPTRHAYAEWDAGVSRVTNADHVRGRTLTELQGVGRVGLEWAIGHRSQ